MRKSKAQLNLMDPLFIDCFAGGGGMSTGMELVLGRPMDIAINHDPDAVLMHKTNHPFTKHYCENIFEVDPEDAVQGRHVAWAHFSPDCTHHSNARGGKPKEKKIRGLAWIVPRWAAKVRPDVISLENVVEFKTWGPLKKGKPIKSKAGKTFQQWLSQLKQLGYEIEYKVLTACDYGAPTSRRRLFVICRCDGKPIVWPEPSHGHPESKEVLNGRLKPWRTAAEIIDYNLPCPSIFSSKEEIKKRYGLKTVRPLADNTQRKIIRGVDKFVIQSETPIVQHRQNTDKPSRVSSYVLSNTENAAGTSMNSPIGTITTGGTKMLVQTEMKPVHTDLDAYAMVHYHSEQSSYVRGQGLCEPLKTVDTANRHGLIAAALCKFYGNGGYGQGLTEPVHTVTTKDRFGLISSFMVKYHGESKAYPLTQPFRTLMPCNHEALSQAVLSPYGHIREKSNHTIIVQYHGDDLNNWPAVRSLLNRHCGYDLAEDEVLLLWIKDGWYYISDIGLRMLVPRELFSAHAFPPDYIIDRDYLGNEYPRTKQVDRCGNSVPPPFGSAIVKANMPEYCMEGINTMDELTKLISVG